MAPLENATVSLYRYYILSGNTGAYRIVEQEKTDANGKSVFHVVPNIQPYKLQFTLGSNTVMTSPTKFTGTTDSYVLNTVVSPMTSANAMPNVYRNFTFINSTQTYAFTWSDGQNIVSAGCLNVKKTAGGYQSTVMNTCVQSSSGSLIYTITDTNGTTYTAQATLDTNTAYSTYSAGVITTDYASSSALAAFGLTGWIVAIIVILTLVLIANETGTRTTVIAVGLGIILMGVVGFIANAPLQITFGIIACIGIIVYKLRT